MTQHRINMVANFSEADAAIKNTINNMRIMTTVANGAGKSGNEGVAKFVKSMQDLDSQALTTRQRMLAMNTLLKEQEMAYNRLSPAALKVYGPDWQSAIDNARNKLEGYRNELKQVEEQSKAVAMAPVVGGKSVAGTIARGAVRSTGIGSGLLSTSGMVSGLGSAAIPAAGAILAITGLTKAAKYNIETNMEFEQSNANLAAVLGKTQKEIINLTENARQLGATTLYTANEITELQTVLARRGFGEQQILAMTHGISNLALATGTGLADSAELAASTMQMFGMRASQMEHIVEVLGVSTAKCALTTEKLGVSLKYVGPTAQSAGFSLEDTVAMLGTLVDAGIDASTAGTALRQIILAMSTENGKLARSFGRPVRSLEDMKEALESVSNAGDVLSDVSENVRATAVPALNALVSNKDRLTELRNALDDVNGKLQDMADIQQDTLRGSITMVKSAWDSFMLSLADSKGYMKDAMDALHDLIEATNNWYLKNWGDRDQQVNSYRKTPEQIAKEAEEKISTLQSKNEESWNESKKNLAENLKNGTIDQDTYNSRIQQIEKDQERFLQNQEYLTKQLANNTKIELENLEKQEEKLEGYKYALNRYVPDGLYETAGALENLSFGKLNAIGALSKFSNGDMSGAFMTLTHPTNDYDGWYTYYKALAADEQLPELRKKIAEKKDELLMYEYMENSYAEQQLKKKEELDEDLKEKFKTLYSDPFDDIDSQIQEALRRYDEERQEAKAKLRQGLIDQSEYDKVMVRLTQGVFEAYGKALVKARKIEKEYKESDFAKLSGVVFNEKSPEYQKQYGAWLKKLEDASGTAHMSEIEKKVADAEKRYSDALNQTSIRLSEGIIEETDALKNNINALSRKYDAYSDALAEATNDVQKSLLRGRMDDLAKELLSLMRELKDLEDSARALSDRRRIDNKTLSSFLSLARGNYIPYEALGLGGMKERINAADYVDIPDKEWETAEEKLNEELKKRGATWYVKVDFETGTLEKQKTRLQEVFESIDDGTSSLHSIVDSIDNVKSSFESMIDTIEKGESAWEIMMSAFDAAMAPLEAAVTIYEAINALKGVSAMLTRKETAAKIEDTIATEVHTEAELADAVASGESASASAAEGIAKGVKSVSWIPIVGVTLGVAAAAAIAGSIAAARKKTEYHADGGFIGGPRGTDVTPMWGTPGELVLNRAQQKNLAAQLVPANQQQGMVPMQPYVNAEQIWLGLSNFLMRTGRGEIVTTR